MKHIKFLLMSLLALILFTVTLSAQAFTRGIYITESTALKTSKLNDLIEQSKKYGIDTFIVDVNRVGGNVFKNNIQKIQAAGIHFVARIVIFPQGATHQQIIDRQIWNKRLALAKYAVSLGASAIQLDYIRYRAEHPGSPEKAQRVLTVLKYFRDALPNTSLQMDIFGIAALKPAPTIGQNVGLFAKVIDVFCPMVYPSHYEPFRFHAVHPYETIHTSVVALKKQLAEHPATKIYAYIELYNYRYFLGHNEKMRYIAAEIKAVHDAGGNGWYVWSPNNHYAPLFELLSGHKKMVEEKEKTKDEPKEKNALIMKTKAEHLYWDFYV